MTLLLFAKDNTFRQIINFIPRIYILGDAEFNFTLFIENSALIDYVFCSIWTSCVK